MPGVDAEDKAEPVFAVLAEARPTDGAAQTQFVAVKFRFFVDLAPDASNHIFCSVDFATEADVFAKVIVVRSAVAVDEQHPSTVGRQNVAERGEYGAVRHWSIVLGAPNQSPGEPTERRI